MAASNVFMSYARKDRSQVQELTETLRQLGHHVWFDESLAGGAKWWAEILHQIEQCHVFLYVLSRASLNSEACAAEKNYAQELGKPLLPVKVESVGAASLPADLAQLQTIDYADASRESLIRLVNAIQNMPEPEPVPSPPPEKPPVPVSYLSQLGRQARSAASSDEQILVIYRLGVIAESDEDHEKRAEALALVDDMSRRHDLFAEAERQIRLVKERARARPPLDRPQHRPAPGTAPETAAVSDAARAAAAQPSTPPMMAAPDPSRTPPMARTPQPQAPKAAPRDRPPWLVPVIIGGAIVLLALIVCVCALVGSQGDSSSMKSPAVTGHLAIAAAERFYIPAMTDL